jgi:hypothetical protein
VLGSGRRLAAPKARSAKAAPGQIPDALKIMTNDHD